MDDQRHSLDENSTVELERGKAEGFRERELRVTEELECQSESLDGLLLPFRWVRTKSEHRYIEIA